MSSEIYSYQNRHKRTHLGTINNEPSRTQQHFKNEVNIHEIIKRSLKTTGQMPMPTLPPAYMDFTNTPDFQQAQDVIAQAQQNFAQLPADVRKRFKNDAMEMLEFIHDKDNYHEALKLGLVNKREEAITHASENAGVNPNPATGGNTQQSNTDSSQ